MFFLWFSWILTVTVLRCVALGYRSCCGYPPLQALQDYAYDAQIAGMGYTPSAQHV